MYVCMYVCMYARVEYSKLRNDQDEKRIELQRLAHSKTQINVHRYTCTYSTLYCMHVMYEQVYLQLTDL